MKTCPQCAETAQDAARRCPSCRYPLPVDGATRRAAVIALIAAFFLGLYLLVPTP